MYDRIHLRTTYYNYAKHLEAKGEFTEAIPKYVTLPGAKVSCILCHRGVQLVLAYSWARPAILVAG